MLDVLPITAAEHSIHGAGFANLSRVYSNEPSSHRTSPSRGIRRYGHNFNERVVNLARTLRLVMNQP